MKSLHFKKARDWRIWLENNHHQENVVWLIFYKKETGEPTIEYESAVEEALCFGWIDSIIKKIDDTKYARKFTPRKETSKWSAINKKRVDRLIQSGRMNSTGLSKIKAAQRNGKWEESDRPNITFDLSEDFQKALNKNPKAKSFFEHLAPTYQKQYIGWINIAKRPETKANRIRESIELLERGEKLGLR